MDLGKLVRNIFTGMAIAGATLIPGCKSTEQDAAKEFFNDNKTKIKLNYENEILMSSGLTGPTDARSATLYKAKSNVELPNIDYYFIREGYDPDGNLIFRTTIPATLKDGYNVEAEDGRASFSPGAYGNGTIKNYVAGQIDGKEIYLGNPRISTTTGQIGPDGKPRNLGNDTGLIKKCELYKCKIFKR